MDVVTHYSPPQTSVSPVYATTLLSAHRDADVVRRDERLSLPSISAGGSQTTTSQSETVTNAGTDQTIQMEDVLPRKIPNPTSTTFNRAVEISLMEPVGSMSLSPANRDVVLAARKGLFILDLENPYDQPRFLPHLTTWVPADVQWNPHPARANWVASTSNNKLLVWNLDRPAAHRQAPILSLPVTSGTNTGSSVTSLNNATPSTLPHPFPYNEGTVPTVSQSSSISHVLNAHTRAITDINWSPFHPEILASCGIDTWMWAWDLREPSRPKQGYSAWNAAMTQVKWNRASPHRLATSCDNKVLIWDDRKGALPLATIEAAQSRVYGIDWSRDTSLGLSRLVTCSLDGSVKWWDLDSPAAQNAIGERRLVTEEETTIETHTPVWRARHLPFGNGVMTLPQRGDTSLCMWAKDKPDEPMHRFEGHRDTVKEYLIRSRGGDDGEKDDRKFQLITWSKDQTLRLWPISEDMMKEVGHCRDTPIRVLQTRLGAANITYRVPPETPTGSSSAVMPLIVSPDGLIQSPTSSSATSPSILPPADVTRSMLSISAKGVDRPSSRLGTSFVVGSPFHLRDNSSDRINILSGSLGHERGHSGSYKERNHHKSSGSSHLTINKEKRSATFLPDIQASSQHRKSSRTTLEPPRESLGISQERMKREELRAERKERHRKRQEVASRQVANKNYMTRGNGGQTGQGRFFVGGQLNKGATGRGAALDAVGWIAGVRMGIEGKDLDSTSAAADGSSKIQSEQEEPQTNAGQVLGEEIKAVSRNVTGVAFEKIDVSTKTCTVTCYGPWAGKSVACFLRISFTFPENYPVKAPRFELEHNASVPLKTRAFLLRKVTSILLEATQKQPREPSMEACIRFLQGEVLEDEVLGGLNGLQGFWLPGDDSDEEEERPSLLKIIPRTSGVSFGPNGQLVCFCPSTKVVEVATTPSAAMAAEMGSTLEGTSIGNGSHAPKSGGARFLHSYTALSGAMNSLARLAKEGMAVQEMDVMSLMADQSFFIKRIQKQTQMTSSLVAFSSKVRDRSVVHQDRLSMIRSSRSRPSSNSRSNRRTRSESPMPRSTHNTPVKPSRSDGQRQSTALEARSSVHIYDLTSIISTLTVLTPPFVRKRSNSMPSTPNSLTPRQEGTFQLSAIPVAPSQNINDENISHRRVATMQNGRDDSDGDSDDSDDQYGDSDSDEEVDAAALLRASQRDAMSPTTESIFDTIIWTVPFGFLYLLMDIMIQQQYGIRSTFLGEASRMASPLLILTTFIYFTAIRPFTNTITLQALLFLIGTSCGTSFLFIYSKSSVELVIRRIPPLAVLWMYSIVRMDLSLLLLSLSIVWGFVLYYDLPVFS